MSFLWSFDSPCSLRVCAGATRFGWGVGLTLGSAPTGLGSREIGGISPLICGDGIC